MTGNKYDLDFKNIFSVLSHNLLTNTTNCTVSHNNLHQCHTTLRRKAHKLQVRQQNQNQNQTVDKYIKQKTN